MTTDTIRRVNPATLLIGANVRKDTTLPPEFVASIREHGVKIPIVAVETQDGLDVVDGQMRTLAAVEVGLEEVPVFVRADVAEPERVVEQLVVNRERTSLSRRDTVAAVKQLALDFKMPAAQIVKKLGISKDDVKHASAIASSDVAIAALDEYEVDLVVAAKIAEHDLTPEEARRVATTPWNTDHALKQVLDARKVAAEVAALTEKATADGVTIADRPRRDSYDPSKNKHEWLDDLVDGDGKKLTPAAHKGCPGHAVYIGAYGYNAPVKMHYVCTDPKKNGHRVGGKVDAEPLSEAEQAARAEVVARNKVWPGIVEVRRTWIREQLLTRSKMPEGWELLVARIEVGIISPSPEQWYAFGDLAHEFLQVEKVGYQQQAIRDLLERPTRASAVLLGIAIAKHERYLTPKDGWKQVDAAYLTQLAAWGYGLSEVEAEIIERAKTAS